MDIKVEYAIRFVNLKLNKNIIHTAVVERHPTDISEKCLAQATYLLITYKYALILLEILNTYKFILLNHYNL